MARSISRFLSYVIIVAFLSTSTNLSYLSQQEFKSQTDTLRSQAAILGLDVSAMQAKLQSPAEKVGKATLMTDMVDNGATEVAAPKSSSTGTIVSTELDLGIKLSLQKHLNRLLKLRRDPKTESIAEQLGIPLELPAAALVDDYVAQILRNFVDQIKSEFGEDIVYNFIYPINGSTESVGLSLALASSDTAAPRSSSGGTNAFNLVTEFAIEKQLDNLYNQIKEASKLTGVTEQFRTELKLPIKDYFSFKFRVMLEDFNRKIRKEFAEAVIIRTSVRVGREEGIVSVSALIYPDSDTAALRSSSSGTSVPDSDERSAIQIRVIQSKLDWLYSEREAIKTAGLKEELRTRITLPSDQYISIGVKDILKAFRSRIQKDFGEDVKTTTTGYADEGGGTIDVLVSIQPDSNEATPKSSSGGTILESRAEKISALHRHIKESGVIKERFDRVLVDLDKWSTPAASEVKEVFANIQKELYEMLDEDIMQILSDPASAISQDDKAVLRDMVSILHQAEQHINNIETITYADGGRLAEDTTPRVLILPATAAIGQQAPLARNELDAIEEHLGVITVFSENPFKAIEDIKSGKWSFKYEGVEVTVPAENIAVVLSEDQIGMADDINSALGTKNILVMSNIVSSQYVPFSQLAMLAKAQLILDKLGVMSQEAGPYRSAFLAIWKNITGSALPGTIEDFMNNPAAYVISILVSPESILGKTELKVLHEMAAKIWA